MQIRSCVLHRAFAFKHLCPHLFQLSALFGDGLLAHPADNFAAVGEDEAPFEEHHALPERVNVRLGIQLKAERSEPLRYLPEAILKESLVRMDEDKIVHIADVVLHAQTLLNPMVEIVQHGKLHKL